MTNINLNKLPKELRKYKDNISKSLLPSISLSLEKENLKIWESKFGGVPYLPKEYDYPIDSYGTPMVLLAQINFSEMPILKDFPTKGILQFYISLNKNSLYGLNIRDKTCQSDFRVIYHKTVIKDEYLLQNNFDFLNEINLNDSPIKGEYKLIPKKCIQPINSTCYNFEEILQINESEEDYDNVCKKLFKYGGGNQIEGYPFFTQYDIRNREEDYDVLLLQIDSTYGENNEVLIEWVDSGIGNFFIKRSHLKNLDFSKVLYNWDCL